MSKEISWTDKPFYLMSKIGLSNWVLSVRADGTVFLAQATGTIDQIWKAVEDLRGGATLCHATTGLVLTANWVPNPFFGQILGGPVTGAPLDASNPAQLWRIEQLGDLWDGIVALLNWNTRLNVYHSDVHGTIGVYDYAGGADNEKWRVIEETGMVIVGDVQYDLAAITTNTNLPPSYCMATIVDNIGGGTAVTSTYNLARQVTTSRSITNSSADTTGTKYTQTFGVKGGIDKVFEVSASAGFEESQSSTITLTDTSVKTSTVTDTLTTQVNVPPGRKYRYQVTVRYGKITVPYTATSTFQSTVSGAAPVTVITQGQFHGVNSTLSEVTVVDITSALAAEHILVARQPVET
jgi:hypothetical protein